MQKILSMLKAHPLLPAEAAVGCPLFLEDHCINGPVRVSRAVRNLVALATFAMERRICHVNVAACRSMTFRLSINVGTVTDNVRKTHGKAEETTLKYCKSMH